MNCIHCNAPISDGAKFCLNCGKPTAAACPTCGNPLPDEAKFCPSCGAAFGDPASAPVQTVPEQPAPVQQPVQTVPVQQSVPVQPAPAAEYPSVQYSAQHAPKSHGKRNVIILVVVLVLLLAGTAVGLFATGVIGTSNPDKLLQSAEKYLDEKNYEESIVKFEKLLEIDPLNVDAYLGLSSAYEQQGDTDKAIKVLEDALNELKSEKDIKKIQKALDKLKSDSEDGEKPAVSEDSAEQNKPAQSTSATSGTITDTTSTQQTTTVPTTTTAVEVSKPEEVENEYFTPSGNAGTIKVYSYYDITSDQKGIEQSKIFESAPYNGKIESITVSYNDNYYDKLAVLIAADDSPDLMPYDRTWYPYGFKRNMFEPMDNYIDLSNPMWDDIRNVIDDYEYNGKHFYVPHRTVTSAALNYNRKTIMDAGLADPYELYKRGEWTWDAWQEMMIHFCNQNEDNIGYFTTNTLLEAFINTTGTNVIGISSDGVISNNVFGYDVSRAVEYLANLGRNGLLYPGWISPQQWATSSDTILFYGMEPEWTYIAATEEIQNRKGTENDIHDTISDFAFVPYPRDPLADRYYISSDTFGYMVPKGARNISGAAEFINLNRLYEIDESVKKIERNKHISPEPIFITGANAGSRKWQITWDENMYDLLQEMNSQNEFSLVFEDMYGFGDELSIPLTDALYASTFGGESWVQQSAAIKATIDSILSEY